MKKVGLSIMDFQGKYGILKALEIAKEIGVDAVDICLWTLDGPEISDYRNKNTIYGKGEEEIITYFTEIRNRAKELGLEIEQTHGRFVSFVNNCGEDAATVENARLDCLATAVLGAKVCVMHGVATSRAGIDAAPELMHQLNFNFFNSVLPFAKKYGIKIATETFGDSPKYGCCDFFGNVKEFLISYNKICAVGDNADYFTICVDTGHSNKAMRYNNPKPGDVIRMLGRNVTVLHLNDNDTFTDQHKVPLSGTIDWKDVMKALEEIGYNGVYNMELSLTHFGKGIEEKYAGFAVEVMKGLLDAGEK